MARNRKATAKTPAAEQAPRSGRKGKQAESAAAPAEATAKRGRQKNLNLPQPGTPEYKKAAAERAEKFHEKTRAIRDLTRQYGMGVMDLAKYCGFPDERGFRPLGGPEIRALFQQAKDAGNVTHTERPAEEWQVRRGRAKVEGASQTRKAAGAKKTTAAKTGTKSAGKASEKSGGKATTKTEGKATPKTGTKGSGKRGKKAEEEQGSMSVAEAVNAPFSALRDAATATGELETVVVPDEEVYGTGAEEQPELIIYPQEAPEKSEGADEEPVQGGTDAEGFFDTKLGQDEPEAPLGEQSYGAVPSGAEVVASGNGHDPEKTNDNLAEWLKAQKPESEKVKLAKAFYLNSEADITSRQAAEEAGINVQSNHSGRVVELAKAGFVAEAGQDDKKTRTWKITDSAIEAWEEVFGVS